MDSKAANSILKKFSTVSLKAYNGSYAYQSGYMEAVVVELLCHVPPHVALKFLSQFEQQTKQMEQSILVDTLKEAA
jgi:hypothetical protein